MEWTNAKNRVDERSPGSGMGRVGNFFVLIVIVFLSEVLKVDTHGDCRTL